MNDKKRIIFVDDEPRILDGLRRMLRSLHKQWDMTFVSGGREALQAFSESTFDVIVSDMRMPDMNGAQLLEQVKCEYPQVVRIALSGQTSKETILSSVGPIHQYLPKPCDSETLRNTIIRACNNKNMLANPKLQGLISQLESLPCLSSLYTELVTELQSDDASIEKVGKIISQDIGMSTKILQLVNSSFFGVRQHISSVSQAVALLGLDIIKALVLTIKIFSHFDNVQTNSFSISDLRQHSLTVGDWSKKIAHLEHAPSKVADFAMVAGLLHDVGKLVLASKIPQDYQQILEHAEKESISIFQAEKDTLQTTHCQIGGYLLGLWGFDDSIIDALLDHHHPTSANKKESIVLAAVHAADVISHEQDPSMGSLPVPQVDAEFLEEIGLSSRFSVWRETCLGAAKVKC